MSGVRLPPDLLAMMAKGVSVIVGSRSEALRPSVMRAVGSHIRHEGDEVTVFLARRQSAQLLQDIAASGQVAVVFSQPSSHRTVQLKASGVRMRAAVPEDAAALASYLASMEHEILQVGFAPELTRAMLAHQLDDVVAVSFTPEQAFDQTPGPQAGARLGDGA